MSAFMRHVMQKQVKTYLAFEGDTVTMGGNKKLKNKSVKGAKTK